MRLTFAVLEPEVARLSSPVAVHESETGLVRLASAARLEAPPRRLAPQVAPYPHAPMKLRLAALTLLCLSALAHAQGAGLDFTQPMSPGGGVLRASQLWMDPSGQNDLDSDAIAWEDFELDTGTTLTRVAWWGEAAPAQGFRISFYHQDPNTIAVQPDLFATGSGPISEHDYTSFSQVSAGAGLYRFEVDLITPVTVNASTRYFISIVGLTPVPFATWGWAQGTGGTNGTFWWQRGAHMYFHLGDDRALSLATAAGWPIGVASCSGDGSGPTCPCFNAGTPGAGCANSTGLGASLAAFGSAQVANDSVVLSVTGCPANTPGLFFGGPNSLAGLPFGDGLRCVGGIVVRLGVVPTSSAGLAQSLLPLAATEGLSGGELRSYQYWYRDPSGPCGGGYNTSNALRLQW